MSCRQLVLLAASLTLAVSSPEPATADWPPEGLPLCTLGICDACCPLVCSDGAGGAFVLWREQRHGNLDLYLQRVTASGAIAPGWPADGVPVCAHPASLNYSLQALAADGSGGVFVTWYDYRNVLPDGSNADIYAQRVLADGSIAPGWTVDGVPVTLAAGSQLRPVVIAETALVAAISLGKTKVLGTSTSIILPRAASWPVVAGRGPDRVHRAQRIGSAYACVRRHGRGDRRLGRPARRSYRRLCPAGAR